MLHPVNLGLLLEGGLTKPHGPGDCGMWGLRETGVHLHFEMAWS